MSDKCIHSNIRHSANPSLILFLYQYKLLLLLHLIKFQPIKTCGISEIFFWHGPRYKKFHEIGLYQLLHRISHIKLEKVLQKATKVHHIRGRTHLATVTLTTANRINQITTLWYFLKDFDRFQLGPKILSIRTANTNRRIDYVTEETARKRS